MSIRWNFSIWPQNKSARPKIPILGSQGGSWDPETVNFFISHSIWLKFSGNMPKDRRNPMKWPKSSLDPSRDPGGPFWVQIWVPGPYFWKCPKSASIWLKFSENIPQGHISTEEWAKYQLDPSTTPGIQIWILIWILGPKTRNWSYLTQIFRQRALGPKGHCQNIKPHLGASSMPQKSIFGSPPGTPRTQNWNGANLAQIFRKHAHES